MKNWSAQTAYKRAINHLEKGKESIQETINNYDFDPKEKIEIEMMLYSLEMLIDDFKEVEDVWKNYIKKLTMKAGTKQMS